MGSTQATKEANLFKVIEFLAFEAAGMYKPKKKKKKKRPQVKVNCGR